MILATGNRHKLRELCELLPGVELRPLPEGVELPPEDGDSFAANALIKARAAMAATGAAMPKDGPTTTTIPANTSTIASVTRPPTRSPSRGAERTATKIGAVAPSVATSPKAIRLDPRA